MTCPLCQKRPAKRHCPAKGRGICSVCCATKRLVEIACPSDCPHLATARAHPNALLRRQQEMDVAALMPTIEHLTERQYQLFFLFQSVIARTEPAGLARLVDADVAEASRTVAAGLETADRGVIYEEQAQGANARQLADGVRALLAEARGEGAKIFDREAAIALRAIEAGATAVSAHLQSGDTGYLDLMARLMQVNRAANARSASPIIAP
jgi:hypothetical protein